MTEFLNGKRIDGDAVPRSWLRFTDVYKVSFNGELLVGRA